MISQRSSRPLGTDHYKSDGGGGGWGKNQKKIHAEGRSNGDVFRKSKFLSESPSFNNITRHNMNKQFVALKEAQQNANQRYTYAIAPFCSQWQVSIFDPSH